jgi:hypothetical protein
MTHPTAAASNRGHPTIGLKLYVTVACAVRSLRQWAAEDDGLDDSPAKMIWIAVAIVIAIAAGAFAISVFNSASSNVPDPVPPAP